MALAASMGVAHAACNTAANTVTCTGGAGAHVAVANGFAGYNTVAASPNYPANITVSGGAGTVSSLTLTLHGYTSMTGAGFNSSLDVGVLLKSPSGRNLQIMRAEGDATCPSGPDPTHCQNNLTFTIQDSGVAFPDPVANQTWTTETGPFKPTAHPGPATAPTSPNYTVSGGPAMANSAAPNGSATLTSVFAGDTVNGTWSLYLVDDNTNKADIQFGSWDIAITFSNATTPSTVTMGTLPPSPFTGASTVLSAQVTAGATGTVTFKDNGVNVTCSEGAQPRTLNGSSAANCTTTFSGEGIHPISATYSGDGTFVSSVGSANVFVHNRASSTGTNVITYCNTGTVTNDGHSDLGYAHTTPYPSAIAVGDGINTDIPGSISTVSVQLKGFTSASTNQVRMLLVAPDGTHAYDFWSNAGGGPAGTGDYNIVDGSPQLPSSGNLSPGTYGPAGYGILPDPFTPGPPSPAPQIPGSFSYAAPMGNPNSKTFISAFTGTGGHGTWSLFLHNAAGAGSNTSLANGWCLVLTPNTGHPTTTTVMANPTQANLGSPVIFTATIASSPPVGNTGTVTFTENGGPLTGAPNNGVANVSNGVAIIVTSGLPEGDHIVNAQYHDGTNTFSDSIGTVNMRVDKSTSTPTFNSGNNTWTYCNTGAITIPAGTVVSNDFGPASPNPSNVFVTNLPGTISSMGVTLKQFHDLQPGNLESLLVGPNGMSAPTTAQTFDFFTRAGGVNAYGPADINFFDVFTTAPNTNPLAANNGPASYGATPTYTPSLFYTLPGTFQRATTAGAFTFNTNTYTPNVGGGIYKNTLPNGTWSLYFDQLINDTGSGANNGWCVNFVENPVTVSATKGHTGRPPNGHFQQGETGASFSFNIKNNGDVNGLGSTGDPDGMHGLKVVDVLDASAFTAGTLPTGSPWNCTAVTNTVTCTSSLAIAPTMSYPTLTIPVIVKDNAPASANNSGSLSGGGITATSAMDSVTIDPAPILAISKGHTGTFTQGQTATWTLQVSNSSATAAGNTNGTTVTVIDTLPTGYTLSSFLGTGWMCAGNMNVVTCTSVDAINGNGGMFPLITLTVNVPADSPTSVSNSAKVFGGGDVIHTNAGSAAMSNTDTVTVIQVPATIMINGSATQSAQINTAFGSLAVTVKDAGGVVIPNYSSVVFTAGTGGNGQSGTFDTNTNTKTLPTNGSGIADPGTFTANGFAGAYTVDVAAGPAMHATFNLTNTAPDLTIVKTNTVSGNANLGATWTWKLHVANAGTGSAVFAATKTLVTDNLPNSNINYGIPSNATNIVGTITNSGAISCSISSNDLSCTANAQTVTMAAGSSFDVTFTATPTAMGTFANPRQSGVCQVDPGNVVAESNEGNNTCSDSVTVTAPDLTAVKSDNVTGATTLGNPWTWKIHVANGGNGPAVFQATQAMLTDDLATNGLNYGTPMVTSTGVTNGGTISCVINGSPSLICSSQAQVVTITPGGFFDVTFSVTPTAVGTYANPRNGGTCMADPASLVPESDETNNTCSGSVVVTAPDLTIMKTHSPSSFTVNDQGDTFTITVTNSGNAPTTGTVTVTDMLPMGLTFAGSPTMGWSCNANGSNPVICTTTNAISGNGGMSSLVLNVNVAGSTGSPLTNNVSVGCTCTESNTGNNTGSDMVTVIQVVNVTLDAVDMNMQHQGLTISLDGGTAFTAPHTYQLTPNSMHTIATTSPQPPAAVGTRFVFSSWSDNGAQSHSVTIPTMPSTYTATFSTQYQLTTAVAPAGGGTVSPATGNFYPSGTVVNLTATANPGYSFSGWTGPVTNPNMAATTVTMSQAQSVTANFMAGATSLKGSLGGKSGPQNARVWSLTIKNMGPGAANAAQVTSFTLTPVGGPIMGCSPVITPAFPILLGNMSSGAQQVVNVTINFTGCPGNESYDLLVNMSANQGAATGTIVRNGSYE